MKKLHTLVYAFICITAASCMHHVGNIDITYNESDQYYYMKAYFNKSQTRDVDEYLDSRIGKSSNMSFVNSQIDGTIALDDHTNFYVEKSPGVLKIKLDKDLNSSASYRKIKAMCEGIKKVLTQKNN